ncbi:MAG: hypothetical protein NTV70_06115 [Acidobacteria bacterium]|nr:hypothetical protein [Acidobacteriota bacterium]
MTPGFHAASRRELLLGLGAIWPFGPRPLELADTRLRVVRRGRSSWRFLHIHGDESTARTVLEQAAPAGLSFFVESERREVPIAGGSIDPNRLFSHAGADRSLRRRNRQWSEAQLINAGLHLDHQRPKLLDALLPRDGGVLIALHNNGVGYSIETEIPLSQKVSFKDPSRPGDFMLATSARDFALMETSPFNCVLQSSAPPPDDGSLSRQCALQGKRYVNIEARSGGHEIQRAMLDWLIAHLPPQQEF